MLERAARPVLLIVVAALVAATFPFAASAQRAEQRQLEEARSRLAELSRQIDAAEDEASEADAAFELADEQLRELEAIVNEVAARVEDQRAAVRDAQRRLDAVEREAEELFQAFSDRIARMYMQGPELSFELMFTADSAEDAMARTAYLKRVTDGDQVDLDVLDAAQARVTAERERLEAEHERLEQMLEEQEELREEAERLRERRALAAAEARQQVDELQQQHDDLEEHEAELEATIRRLQEEERRRQEEERRRQEEERRRQEEAQRQQNASSSGSSRSTPTATSSSGYRWPTCGRITSEYGPRWGRIHRGLDIGVSTGTTVVASRSGTVLFAGWQGGYGNLVLVDHHDGVVTAYAHLSQFRASPGASVSQGQTIALSGNTGNSTGPHLHFETRVNGAAVNPRQYLSGSPC